MKKLTALIITLVFAVSMVMAVPVQAEGTVDPVTTTVNATLANGANTTVSFTIATSGTYEITVNQNSADSTAGYKLFVNNVPMGVVHVGTAGAPVLGSYELLDGTNIVRLQAIDVTASVVLTSLTATYTGPLTGNCITVSNKVGEQRFTIGLNGNTLHGSGSMKKGMRAIWTVNVPSAGNYEVYYVGANNGTDPQVELYYKNQTVAVNETYVCSTYLPAPSGDEWNSLGDMAYVGTVPLTANENNEIRIRVSASPRSNPKGLMIKKVTESAGSFANADDLSWGKLKKRTAFVNMELQESGKYAIIADVAAGNVDAVHTVKIYKYSETGTNHLGDCIGTTIVDSPEEGDNGYGSWIGDTVLAFAEFDASETSFAIDNNVSSLGIRNLRLKKVDSFATTKLYLGETVAANKEISFLRNGTITVQTTLEKTSDAVVIAALYENGKIVDYDIMTQDGTVFSGTLDTTSVNNINASYVKVFVWDSLNDGTLTPLTKPHVR